MKIYTRSGDDGTTGLYDGSRIQKDDIILDVLGTIDELSSHIGLLMFYLKKDEKNILFLRNVQTLLLNIGSIIATQSIDISILKINEMHISGIEKIIDYMDNYLEPLTVFIVQDGKNEKEANAHICRTITRRCERELYKYKNVDENICKFMNRLSDYFFTLARYTSETLKNEEKSLLGQFSDVFNMLYFYKK
jgi:cob(I)alamin adenosyltransferase